MNCLLCGSETRLYFVYEARQGQQFYQCTGCEAVQLHPDFYVNAEEEKTRYLTHNNDVNDKRYQKFVFPIVDSVLTNFNHTDSGLDFGSGTGPVITKMLRDVGYNIRLYDPIFTPDDDALNYSYDYIACCEVVEHFHQPKNEFHLLKSLLKSGGKLFIKTDLFDEDINFEKWRYKDDETHTFLYHARSFEWIRDEIGFSDLEIRPDLIILSG